MGERSALAIETLTAALHDPGERAKNFGPVPATGAVTSPYAAVASSAPGSGAVSVTLLLWTSYAATCTVDGIAAAPVAVIVETAPKPRRWSRPLAGGTSSSLIV